MPTETKRLVNPSTQHISRTRLINFGFEFEPLSKSESEHFDSCSECRSAFRGVMETVVLPASSAEKHAV